MQNTVVGAFDDRQEALAAENELIQSGFNRDQIRVAQKSQPSTSAGAGGASDDQGGLWQEIKDFFGFGEDEQGGYYYREAARRGMTFVAASAEDEAQVNRAVQILDRHHPVDIDKRAQQGQAEGWTSDAPARQQQQQQRQRRESAQPQGASEQEAIPVVQEELQVGKRPVQVGGVRVYSRVEEQPVEKDVALRQEHVNVERRPTDRPVDNADRAFQERTIEARETVEEPVVAKQARVVEEVSLNKEVTEETQRVRDTVRRTDVEVERLDAQDFEQDYQRRFAGTGRGYEHYRPAYEFGSKVAADQNYSGQDWDSAEPRLRQSFEQRYPGSDWNEVRDAVHVGYDRRRGRAANA